MDRYSILRASTNPFNCPWLAFSQVRGIFVPKIRRAGIPRIGAKRRKIARVSSFPCDRFVTLFQMDTMADAALAKSAAEGRT